MWGNKKDLVLKTGETYTFNVSLRREPPAHYTGRRCKLRVWANLPLKLDVVADGCTLEAEPKLIAQSDKTVTWQVVLTPQHPGTTILALRCNDDQGHPFAEVTQWLQIEGEPQPTQMISPISAPSKVPHERSVMVDLSAKADYRVDERHYPYGSSPPSKREMIQLRQEVIDELANLSTHPLAYFRPLHDRISQALDHLLQAVWWHDLPEGTHVTLIQSHYALPFEWALLKSKPWGYAFAIGHIVRPFREELTKTRKAKLVVIADHAGIGCASILTALNFARACEGAEQIKNIKPEQFSADVYKLRDMIQRAQANLIYLAGTAIPDRDDVRAEGLDIQLNGRHHLHVGRDHGLTPDQASKILPHDAIVFLALNSATRLEAMTCAYLLLEFGARVVITSLCTLPESVNQHFASLVLQLISAHGDSITVGQAVSLARQHFPAGLGFALFGDACLRVRV